MSMSLSVNGKKSIKQFTMVVAVLLFSDPLFEEPELGVLDDAPLPLLGGFPFNADLYPQLRKSYANVLRVITKFTKE